MTETPETPDPSDPESSSLDTKDALDDSAVRQTPPRTPYTAAANVVKTVQLESVRFGAFSAQGFATADDIPDDAVLNGASSFLRPIVHFLGNGFVAETTLVFRLSGRIPDREDVTYAVVQATLDAEYSPKADSTEPFSNDDLEDFAFCYCPFHVWGYWREFVQSSLARLDLPHVTVPLFLIDQATKLVRDKLD